jgi:uncharacterized membrane protein YgdD (TMEM256/DUF423 family)
MKTTDIFWFRLGAVTMAIGVAIGAFGAHGLKNVLDDSMKAVFETGVRYHLIHGLALFAVAWAASRASTAPVQFAGWAFTSGIVLFSGSLYALALTGTRAWGMVTPFGGLAFIAGWIGLASR